MASRGDLEADRLQVVRFLLADAARRWHRPVALRWLASHAARRGVLPMSRLAGAVRMAQRVVQDIGGVARVVSVPCTGRYLACIVLTLPEILRTRKLVAADQRMAGRLCHFHPFGTDVVLPGELKMVRDSAVSGTSGGQISAKARYVNSLHPPGRLLHLSPVQESPKGQVQHQDCGDERHQDD